MIRLGAHLSRKLATALALLAALAGCGGSGGGSREAKPAPLDAAGLSSLVRSSHQPVYWAGLQGGERFELIRAGTGRVYVRYVPDTGRPDPRGTLTVGTYRLADAHVALRRAGRARGAHTYRLPHGGRAVVTAGRPTNVYVVFRSRAYQVEVFDPAPGRALRLVRAGSVRPVLGSPLK